MRDMTGLAKGFIRDFGHEALTVRALAELTGLSHTSLYYYFSDMDAFLWHLRHEMILDMQTDLATGSSDKAAHQDILPEGMRNGQTEDSPAGLLDGLYRYCAYFLENPRVFRFFYFHPFVRPDDDEREQQMTGQFQTIWQNAFAGLLQAGRLTPEQVAPAAKSILYAMQGLLLLRLSGPSQQEQPPLYEELDELVQFILFR